MRAASTSKGGALFHAVAVDDVLDLKPGEMNVADAPQLLARVILLHLLADVPPALAGGAPRRGSAGRHPAGHFQSCNLIRRDLHTLCTPAPPPLHPDRVSCPHYAQDAECGSRVPRASACWHAEAHRPN